MHRRQQSGCSPKTKMDTHPGSFPPSLRCLLCDLIWSSFWLQLVQVGFLSLATKKILINTKTILKYLHYFLNSLLKVSTLSLEAMMLSITCL